MTIYTVHIRDRAAKSDLVVVQDGFSWGAALFGFLWAMFIGAWDAALALFVIQSAAGVLIPALIADPAAQGAAQLGLAVMIGFAANELRRVLLGLRGYAETGVVTGAGREDAERRYFDHHPDVTARLLQGACA